MIDYFITTNSNSITITNLNIILIDYGSATKYIKDQREEKDVKVFQGNILFASVHQMRFKSTKRRDDLYSLCLNILFMLNDFELPLYEDNIDYNNQNQSDIEIQQ